jgi:hypothetical protein
MLEDGERILGLKAKGKSGAAHYLDLQFVIGRLD